MSLCRHTDMHTHTHTYHPCVFLLELYRGFIEKGFLYQVSLFRRSTGQVFPLISLIVRLSPEENVVRVLPQTTLTRDSFSLDPHVLHHWNSGGYFSVSDLLDRRETEDNMKSEGGSESVTVDSETTEGPRNYSNDSDQIRGLQWGQKGKSFSRPV